MAGAGLRYETTIDRAGLALGAGGVLAGLVALVLVAAGGERGALALAVGFILGAVFAMAGIVAVAGPLWLALHLAGRRGPGAAAATGGLVALTLVTIAQTWGIDTFDQPTLEGVNGYRLASALATGAFVAVAAAAIGWTMQRIAYRRT